MLFLLACGDATIAVFDDTAVGTDPKTEGEDSGSETADTGTAPDYSMWDGASLEIVAPTSGDFLPWGDPNHFEARVVDEAGEVMDFDDITWKSDIDSSWFPTGAAFDDEEIDVGEHAITATAELPNGDRLAYTIGGVLVQDPFAGLYSGTLQVDVSGDYNGTTYEVGCSGPLTLTVDAYGETVLGDSSCLLSLFGFDLASTYAFDLENADGVLGGETDLDLVIANYAMETTGTITEDGALEGAFTTDVYGVLALTGTFTATRITRDLSE